MKTYSRPHYRQSHTWQRFARILSDVRDYAYQRKEDALEWCFRKGTHGFSIPVELELEATDARGLDLLTTRVVEEGDPFPETRLRTRYNSGRDTLEVEVTLHQRTRQKVQAVRVGLVPEKDARWVRPLMKSHIGLRAFIADVERTGGTTMHTGLSVTVAIRRPDQAAREWMDVYDNRKQKAKGGARQTRRTGVPAYIDGPSNAAPGGTDYNKKIKEARDEISRLNVKASKMEAKKQSCAHIGRKIAGLKGSIKHYQKKAAQSGCRMAQEPTEEEWLRENLSARETCMTDLGNEDYWNARHQM